jgi:hypothetical protein
MDRTGLTGRSALKLLAAMLLAVGLTGAPARADDSQADDGEPALEWSKDYDEAVKLAGDESRALLILITTPDMERTSPFCRFAGDIIRRAVRDANVVPLKLLPPAVPNLAGCKPEEAKKRQEAYNQALKQYGERAKGMGVSVVPSVVYAAPDAAKLAVHPTPSDDAVRAVLARLPEMIKAHEEAVAKQEKKPEPANKEKEKEKEKEKPAGAQEKPAGAQEKPAEEKKPAPAPAAEKPPGPPEDF